MQESIVVVSAIVHRVATLLSAELKEVVVDGGRGRGGLVLGGMILLLGTTHRAVSC